MKKRRINKKRVFMAIIVLILLLFNIILGIFFINMSAVDNNKNSRVVEVTIQNGMSVDSILDLLEENNLIKSKLFSKIYIKIGEYNLQAGVYDLNTGDNAMEIIKMIANGKVTTKYNVSLTFKEGKNIMHYAKVISEKTNNKEEDVYNTLKDVEYIDSLIEKYWFLTDEIKNKEIYYPLEGYLFPETYFFDNKDVDVKTIFATMLEQTNKILLPHKDMIEKKNMTIHEFLTLASIVELEGLYSSDRAIIAGVFYNRLKNNDSLGSDVTTYYAVRKDMGEFPVLHINDINFVSPYNTRLSSMAGKLPVGPIGNAGRVSIDASINPTDSDYYYFVADCSTGKTVFTKTYNEHVSAVNKIKATGCKF